MSNLVRRDPLFSDFDTLREEMMFPIETQFNKIFDSFFNQKGLLDSVKATNGYPKLDAFKENDQFKIRVAIPGVEKDKIQLDCTDNVLTISGSMSEEYRTSNDTTKSFVRELYKNKFSRKVMLPDYTVGEPEAILKNGILTLSWKCKPSEIPKSKCIAIKEE